MRSSVSLAPLTCRHLLRWHSSRLSLRSFTSKTAWRSDAARSEARSDVLELLTARGLIKDFAGDRDVLRKALQDRPVGFYAGIDPTAPSLHLGHLLPLMVLFWVFVHGHNPVSLIGSATAQIGDPSGRLVSRARTARSTHLTNAEALTSQVAALWKNAAAYSSRHGYDAAQHGKRQLLDNRDWLARLNIIDFLRSFGHAMRIGAMLGRDTVKNKMEKGDGMSFAEFTYPLLQAWDWWHMYRHHGVQVQIGGSDQFGNIIAGLDAVKAVAQAPESDAADGSSDSAHSIPQDRLPMGMTTPLLTTASGEKFGKSAGNAIWLDPQMTSSFDLYGFLLRTADADVERYLKLFTFVPLQEIAEVMQQHEHDPGARVAQHLLASEVLELVHGQEEAAKTRRSHSLLRASSRSPNAGDQTAGIDTAALAEAETAILPRSLLVADSFPRLLYHAGLVSTKSEGARLVKSGGAYVAPAYDPESTAAALDFTSMKDLRPDACVSFAKTKTVVVRLGKWKVRVIKAIDDDEFVAQGLDAPGWVEHRAETVR